MTHAVLYARFSPRPDADKCQGIAVQLDLCRRYCTQRGYDVRDAFADPNRLGSDVKRPGLWRAVGSLGRGDVLVVYRWDRLARGMYLSEVIRHEVHKIGARLEAVSGAVEGDGPEVELVRQVLQAIDEYQRKITAIRTSLWMRHHQAHGRRMSRFPPYGWELDPADPKAKTLRPCPTEQAVVARIRELRAQGHSLRRIASALDAEGRPCRGRPWRYQTVDRVLKREG